MIASTILTENEVLTTFKTNNAGMSLTNHVAIPTLATGIYSCIFDWWDWKSGYINTRNNNNNRHFEKLFTEAV